MLGKSAVGSERKIQEPTESEARRNISFFYSDSHGMQQRGRKPYPIPAKSLLNNSKRYKKSDTD